MEKLRAPIKMFGGKGTMFNDIIKHFPSKDEYDTYIEPFSGSYSIGLKLEDVPKIEIYNDLDRNVYSLYKVLANPEMFSRFKDRCDLILYNEDLRKEFKDLLKTDNLSIEDRAFYFFYVNRTSHNGVGGFSKNTYIRRNMSKSISDFLSSVDRLPELHNRLSNLIVTNTDGIELIKKHNDQKTLIYCQPENEKVIMNGKHIKIQDVKVDDICGDNNKVVSFHKRVTENEKIINVNVMGLGNSFPIKMSEDHIIFVFENDKIIEKKAKDLKVNDKVIIEPFDNKYDEPKFSFQQLNKSLQAKQINFSGNLEELSELIGFYAAEGHSQNGLLFSFHHKEIKYLERVKSLIKNCFNLDSKIYHNSPHATVSQVRVYSRNLESFFKDCLISGISTTKKINDLIMKLNPDIQILLLKSWLKGDGGIWKDEKINDNCKFKRSGNRNKIKLTGTSSSEELINQLYQISLRCGLHPSIKKRENSFDLYFSNKYDIEKLTNIKTNGRCVKRRHWVNNFMISPITKISVEYFTGNMYDITTEKGYYYMNYGVKSHNCDPPYELSTRTAARYSVDMDNDGQDRFLKVVIESKSKILISGYDCERYNVLSENGFKKVNFEVKTISGNFKPKTKVETLWFNY